MERKLSSTTASLKTPASNSLSDTSNLLDFSDIQQLISKDMNRVNEHIRQSLNSDVILINQISEYLINSGGKRMRPILLLLVANAFNYKGNQHINLAAVIEFIHTATLLHDDVVDESTLRRGNSTVNAIWGNSASVLVGDFLYSRSFQLMLKSDSMKIMKILADTTNVIAEGEVLQLLNSGNPDTTVTEYMNVIEYKTAKLFEASARLGCVISNQSEEDEQSLANYGKYLGVAFQITDDVLDYTSNAGELGKNIGDDLAEGKPTLPLIYALNSANSEEKQLIRHAIENCDVQQLPEITDIIKKSGAIEASYQQALDAAKSARNALTGLADSPYSRALNLLPEFAVRRQH